MGRQGGGFSENSQPKLSIKLGSGRGSAGDTVVNKTHSPRLGIIGCGGGAVNRLEERRVIS